MKITHLHTMGWENAIRGMRYSFDSEHKTDSKYAVREDENGTQLIPYLGKEDLVLMQKLIKGGSSHRKFLRAIHIQMSVTASMTWWKHFDTYKVSTTALSRSTMHTIMKKGLTVEDDFTPFNDSEAINVTIDYINTIINKYNEIRVHPERDPIEMEKCFLEVIDILPMCYNQERMVDCNYETIFNIIDQRMNHKLKHEWKVFCEMLLDTLPYAKYLYIK